MIFKAPHGAFSFVLAVAIFELLWYCNPNQLGSPCYVAQLMYEAMDVCERRYRAYDPKDLWIMVDNDNKLHSYASKKPNQLNNFGPCWVVIYWLVDHPEVAEQFGIKVGFV